MAFQICAFMGMGNNIKVNRDLYYIRRAVRLCNKPVSHVETLVFALFFGNLCGIFPWNSGADTAFLDFLLFACSIGSGA